MRRTYLRDVISQALVVLRTKLDSDILLAVIIPSKVARKKNWWRSLFLKRVIFKSRYY